MKSGKRNIYKYVHSVCFLFLMATLGCTDGNIGATDSSSSSKSAPTTNNNSIINPLTADKLDVDLYSGDTYRVSITGGLKPYSFEDVSGHFDQSNYNYKSPFSANPLTETIKIIDSLGSSINVNFNIKTYEPEIRVRSSVLTAYTAVTPYDFVVLPDGTFLISAAITTYMASYSPRNIILRSFDGGNNYTVVYTSPNANPLRLKMLSNGNVLVLNQVPNNSNGLNLSVKVTTNKGDSFSDLSTVQDITFSNIYIGQVSGSLFLFGSRKNVWDNNIGVLYKSTDNGITWNKISEFDFNYLTALCTLDFVGFVETSLNNYLVSINVYDYGSGANFVDQWLVQKSNDGGQTWSASDAYVFTVGKAIMGVDMVKLQNGNILSFSWSYSSTGVTSAIIRLSTNAGASWSSANTYNYVAGKSTGIRSVFMSSSGKVWMIAGGMDSSNLNHNILRYSTDGITWVVASDATETTSLVSLNEDISANLYYIRTSSSVFSGYYSKTETEIVKRTPANVVSNSAKYIYYAKALTPTAALMDNNGNLLVGGSMVSATYDLNNWITQISTDNGLNWSDTDTYIYPASSKSASLTKMITTKSGVLFGLGYGIDNSGNYHLIVRKGISSGAGTYSWTTVNDSRETATSVETPVDILESNSGKVFIVGTSGYSGVTHWIVKKSSADFSTWTKVDDYTIPGSVYNSAIGIFQDSLGRIYSVGYGGGSALSYVLRISDDDGVTWSNQRIWNTYTKNYTTISNDNVLYNVGLKGTNLTFEKSIDRGLTWTVIGQKTISGLSTINSIKVIQDNIFIFGKFPTDSTYSSTLRYNTSQNQLTFLDSLQSSNKTIGLLGFDCQNQSWCLLSSQVGFLVDEVIGTLRRMSK